MPHCHTLIAALREKGFRITPQREMVIEAIAHSGRHMTAEEVYEEVLARTRSINLATVYRTLDFLVEEGLASRNDLGSGRVVYSTARHGPHVHLVCRQCHRVIEADEAILEPLGERCLERYGFEPDLRHLSLTGLCVDCRARSET
ncbi:MAG: Fur family transcriptional regulator [Chloroflexia bacterium]